MINISHFIDYFPGENSFVIPVFSDDNNQNYVQIIDSTKKSKMVNLVMNESHLDYDKMKRMSMKERKIQAYEHITVENIAFCNDERISAFKLNTDLILIGQTDNLIEQLVIFIGTMSGNLAMYDEIISIILRRKNDLSMIAKNMKRSLDLYKKYNNLNVTIDTIKNIRLDYSFQDSVKVIKNKKELVEIDYISIIFRKIFRSDLNNKKIDFEDEIKRIHSFKDILIKEIKKNADLQNQIFVFE